MNLLRNLLWVAMLAVARAESAKPTLVPRQLAQDMSREELRLHLTAFATFAREQARYNGSREFRTTGFKRSRAHIVWALKRFNRVAEVYVEPHEIIDRTKKIWLRGPSDEDVKVTSVRYNTRVRKPIKTDLVQVPVDDKRGSGCFSNQWKGVDAHGRIVLVKGGHCNFTEQVILAKTHGAKGVLFYNAPSRPSLGAENGGMLIPVGIISHEVASNWSNRLALGEKLRVKFRVDVKLKRHKVENIIAQTRAGNPDEVIMLGTRIDSDAGPGVNDNASGCAALLEMVDALQHYVKIKRRIIFAFWVGPYGSQAHASRLGPEGIAKIKAYLNVNTVATRNPRWTVFRNGPRDSLAAEVLTNWLERTGNVDPVFSRTPEQDRDSVHFRRLGIPCSGISTGADECRGLPCDNWHNIDLGVLHLATQAVAFAGAELATRELNRTHL